MSEIFKNIPQIKYEGKDSKNPFAFKFYNPDQIVLGKKMSEHLPFAMAWCTDIMAQQFGIHFGKHKLCPKISPKKTVEGSVGGILGGITTGMPLIFRVGFKPTPSIAKPQRSVNLKTMENVTINIQGRHDPCIVPRAVPVVEAAAAIALMDLLLDGRL